MKPYLDKISASKTTDEACDALQNALNALRAKGYLGSLPDYYSAIQATSPEEVQDWFEEMKDDEQSEEEGHLKEILKLFNATLKMLKKLDAHKEYD